MFYYAFRRKFFVLLTSKGNAVKLKKYQNNKTVIIILIVGFVLFLVIWNVLVYFDTRVIVSDYNGLEAETAADGYVITIQELSYESESVIEEDKISIRGWIVKQGVEIDNISLHVVFRNTTNNTWYVLPTTIEERPDVTEYFNDGLDYDYCGFYASAPNEEISADEYDFEIYILMVLNEEQYFVDTETTLKTYSAV